MIAERLRSLRREHGLSKRDLVSLLPLNYSTYANYESGFREPNSEVLQLLARHFDVSLDYLIGVSENRRRADEITVLSDDEHRHVALYRMLDSHGKEIVDMLLQKEYERTNFLSSPTTDALPPPEDEKWVMLKVYQQRASAGLGSYLDEGDAEFELMRFASTPVSEKADFCVAVRGNGMEPKISDGDIVFVKSVPKVEPDNVGIFVYEGEVYCKRLRIDYKRGFILLESLNRSYATKKIDQPELLRTVGLVIGIAE